MGSERDFRLTLIARIGFLTFMEKVGLFKSSFTIDELSKITKADLEEFSRRKFRSRNWSAERNFAFAEKEFKILAAKKINLLYYEDEKYPPLLREMNSPPFLLFYRGNVEVLCESAVSVVGTRRLTANGRRAAYEFAKSAALHGITVVSGFARGADVCAHSGVLDAYFGSLLSGMKTGKTVAVLPCGCDTVQPKCNAKTALGILQIGGCLLSEYPPAMEVAKWMYVRRNAIIAALSRATVVVEAPTGSGALLTAAFALDFNRELFFHESTFSDEAQKIEKLTRETLRAKCANDKIYEEKLLHSAHHYVDEGAVVIKSFEDYSSRS